MVSCPLGPSGARAAEEGGQHRAEYPSWMEEEVAPADIPKQWQRIGIKADWIQLPVEQYLAALPTLKQGVIAGVFRQKKVLRTRREAQQCTCETSTWLTYLTVQPQTHTTFMIAGTISQSKEDCGHPPTTPLNQKFI